MDKVGLTAENLVHEGLSFIVTARDDDVDAVVFQFSHGFTSIG